MMTAEAAKSNAYTLRGGRVKPALCKETLDRGLKFGEGTVECLPSRIEDD
jgi:hypothetical protein